MEDKHIVSIPSEVVQANIDATLALLVPYLLPLTPEKWHDLPKMGNKKLSFVEKAHVPDKQNPRSWKSI